MPQSVVRVDLPSRFADDPGLLERFREHQFSYELFRGPTLFHEVAGQPVQQLGMRWLIAQSTEVIRRGDQSRPKDPLPDAVDIHPRSEGMLGLK